MKATLTVLAAAVLLCGGVLSAGTTDWTEWTTDTGTNINGVMHTLSIGVTVAGPRGYTNSPKTDLAGIYYNYPSWTPSTTFTGGGVGNAPPKGYHSIMTLGYLPGVSSYFGATTIYFSGPVRNPVIAIWSLGGQTDPPSNLEARFDFLGAPFTILGGGPIQEAIDGSWSAGNGTSIYVCADNSHQVCGVEGAGLVRFSGSFNTLSFTNPVYENNYAFTVGADTATPNPNPEPATIAMFGAGVGIMALGLIRRKR